MIVHRASSYGRCVRASVADRLGMKTLPTSDVMQGLYDAGNAHEEACIAAMAADGWQFIAESDHDFGYDEGQIFFKLPIADGVHLTGHLDGIIWAEVPEGQRVLEIKSPSTYHTFEHAYKTADYSNPYMSRIAWQVSAYMVATGLECVMACLDGDVVKTFGIEVPPHSREAIVARVMEIEILVAAGTLPGGCSQVDWPCPFAYLHDERTVTPIDDPAIIDDAREYLRWGAQERLAKAAKEKLRDQLLARLQVGTYQTGDAVTTVYEQAGVSRWDEESLVARYGPDVRTYKKPGTPSRRMKVTDADT